MLFNLLGLGLIFVWRVKVTLPSMYLFGELPMPKEEDYE